MIAALDLKDASSLRAEECSGKWARVAAAQARAAQGSLLNPRLRVLDSPLRFSQAQASRPAEWELSACASAHRA